MNKRYSILIIDDSPIIIERLLMEINEIDQKIDFVIGYSFEEAKKIIQSGSFDIVILDINLHDKSGIDLLRYLKSIDTAAKVIMMTGDDSPEKQKVCFDLGADYFLNKFIHLENLPEIVKSIFIK